MINKAIDNLRYRIVNRYVGCLRDIEVDSDLREQLKWSDNNKIIGQIAYSIHNIVNFTDEAFRPFDARILKIRTALFLGHNPR
ncbi:hypothetical protein [Leuconostoc suionicum]|uniref:hypothetical protein n=1 Tax=Leuconostoc suionicum TaxID=1511761 RepID=UPI0021AADEBF|nr:hypothetical protein [Leuconostoc suionicum]